MLVIKEEVHSLKDQQSRIACSVLYISSDDNLLAFLKKRNANPDDVFVHRIDGNELLTEIARERNHVALVIDAVDPAALGLAKLTEKYPDIPALLLCNHISEVEKYMRQGVDDFVIRPYSAGEVIARLNNMIVRVRGHRREISAGTLVIDLLKRTVVDGDREVTLTGKAFDVLALLASTPGQVYTMERIYKIVWNDSEANLGFYDRNMMSFISKLRKKVEPDSSKPRYILTQWGVGYYFNDKI